MPVSPARLDALLAIARLLAPSARALPGAVTQAATQPAAYHRVRAARLEDRGIEAPRPDLPWIALVDGLIAARACSEIDWKTDAENVAWAIGKLRGVPRGAFAWMKREPDLDDRSTWELLEMSGRHLRERGLQLAMLAISSDSYCLVVVPVRHAKKLVALARAARFGGADLFGDNLAAASKDRVRREQRDAAEEKREAAREARRPKPKLEYFAKGKAAWWLATSGNDLSTGFEAPGCRYSVLHHHASPGALPAARRAQIAVWTAHGFRALTAAQAAALPKSTTYEGIRPFPAKARYLVQNGWIVRAYVVDGSTRWELGGAAGKTFGSVQNVYHHATPAEAEAACAAEIERWSPFSKEVTRTEIIALYKKKTPKR
jgi:hypothetical protein